MISSQIVEREKIGDQTAMQDGSSEEDEKPKKKLSKFALARLAKEGK